MRARNVCFVALSACVGILACQSANAVVLVSDDFSSATSGVGWAAGNAWEGLIDGAVSTNPTGAANVQSFRDFSTPVDASNGVTYIRVSYTQLIPGTGPNWGGLAFFEGVEGAAADETFFLGNPEAGFNNYGIDAKAPGALVDSHFPINTQSHTLIAEINTTGPDDTYKIWVDNFNLSVPSGSGMIVGGGPIDAAWGTLRLASAGANTDIYDNLTIGTSAADVGLISIDATLTINRTTGIASLSSSAPLANVVGYSLTSAGGTLTPAGWIPITGHYDAPSNGGNGSVDSDDEWTVLSSTTGNLAEFTFDTTPGTGGTIGASPVNLGSIWAKSPIQDLIGTLMLDDNGEPLPVNLNIVYQGTAIVPGDLNGDGDLNGTDWTMFKSGQGAVNNALTALQAYQKGDMNGDFGHDLADFDLFAEAYDLANGAGSFVSMVQGVPEPSSLALVGLVIGTAWLRGSRRRVVALVLAVVFSLGLSVPAAHAVIFAQDDFSAEGTGIGWKAGDNWDNVSNGVGDTQFANAKFRDLATPLEPYLNDKLYIAFDFQTTSGGQWGGVAFFEGATFPAGGAGSETLFIGDPGQYDGYGIDLKQGAVLPANNAAPGFVVTNTAPRRLIVELDFDNDGVAPFDDKYSLWIDSFNPAEPTFTTTIQNSPIDAAWNSVRLQSAGGGEFFKVDNLIITDEPALVFSTTLDLQVNKSTGQVTLRNPTGSPVSISAYSIESAGGMLNAGALPGDFNGNLKVDAADYTVWRDGLGAEFTAADYDTWKNNFGLTGSAGGWSSLADQNLAGFPAGNGTGNGWEEGANPSISELEEYFLTGQSTVNNGAAITLGNAYGGGVGGANDLIFKYRSGGELKLGSVTYVGGAAALSAVPEPHTIVVAGLGAVGLLWGLRRRNPAADR